MTNDEKILKRVHFITPKDGKVPRDFEIDPEKVHEVKRRPGEPATGPNGTKMYRYVIGVGGEDREKAVHEFHDRVLQYPTRNGIFALYKSQVGTAQLMLDVKIPLGSNSPAKEKLSDKVLEDMSRVQSFKDKLQGHRMLVIRGAFTSREEFIDALQNAVQSRPGEHLFHPELPSLIFDAVIQDSIALWGDALKLAGKKGKQIAPNVPASRLVDFASNLAIRAGSGIHHVNHQLNNLSCRNQASRFER